MDLQPNLIQQKICVQYYGMVSAWFKLIDGVKQGCICIVSHFDCL